jgi:hypothetical protein
MRHRRRRSSCWHPIVLPIPPKPERLSPRGAARPYQATRRRVDRSLGPAAMQISGPALMSDCRDLAVPRRLPPPSAAEIPELVVEIPMDDAGVQITGRRITSSAHAPRVEQSRPTLRPQTSAHAAHPPRPRSDRHGVAHQDRGRTQQYQAAALSPCAVLATRASIAAALRCRICSRASSPICASASAFLVQSTPNSLPSVPHTMRSAP